MQTLRFLVIASIAVLLSAMHAGAGDTRSTEVYKRIKAQVDAVPAIDTHDHLWPFEKLPSLTETKAGKVVNLHGVWRNSYLSWYNSISPWMPDDDFDSWWGRAKHNFDNVRSASFYRYQLPAFQDLYGVDFDRITDAEAKQLNERIIANYKDQKWLYHVVTERANIELMFNDPYWSRYEFVLWYPWEVKVFNVNPLVQATHAAEFSNPFDSPFVFAAKHGMPMDSLDDYLKVLEKLFTEAKDNGAVCLKSTLAYLRTLKFERVSREAAEKAFGKRRTALSEQEIKDFEDFIFWRLCELSAKYELPFQIHTGQARIQGSNPMNLVDLIEANPKTKFILFHGGFPWVGETAVIVQKHGFHVWVDSVWLPELSYSMAKRAFHEWLDAFPSNRIMWGADCNHAEGIYGATEFHRRCISEVLAEKVTAGDLIEVHAVRIGKQIMRDNALDLFPQLKERLWKHKGIKMEPTAAK
ncbi:MAG: amidohydrolase family protein [Planctomycetia bacterium]|nr:amidohydrolase family protein [Planctomycetia bacterium]